MNSSRPEVRTRDAVLDRVARTVERVMPLVRVLIPPVRALALVGAVAALVNIVLLWRWLRPLQGEDWVVGGLGGAALLLPAVLLTLFWLALREVREVPRRIRNLPEAIQRQRDTLTGVVRRDRSLPRGIWQLGRTLFEAKDELLVYVPLLELLNPLFLLGVALAVPAVMVEVVVAAVLLARAV